MRFATGLANVLTVKLKSFITGTVTILAAATKTTRASSCLLKATQLKLLFYENKPLTPIYFKH